MSMSLGYYNTLTAQPVFGEDKENFIPSFKLNEPIDFETSFKMIFSSKSSEEGDDLNILNHADSYTFISSLLDPNPMPSLNDIVSINSLDSGNENDSLSSSNLFSNIEKNPCFAKEGEGMLKRKRFQKRRPRKDNQDNIRKKIKRGFFNSALIKKLNEKLQRIGNKKYFKKFSQKFVSDVNKKRNKEIFNMTLFEILEKKELYLNEDKDCVN